MWLNSGVPPAQVAERGGTSVAMLSAVYAQCISGHGRELLPLMEAAQTLPAVHTAP